MIHEQFAQLSAVVMNRRTVKPATMNGKKIEDSAVLDILELANWAPTHGRTEPWRFVIYSGEKVQEFCKAHAELYKQNVQEESFLEGTYKNLSTMGDNASHIVVVVMERGTLPNIPVWEEIAATAVAAQHILLGASAMGIASFWSTGGMIQKPAMKSFLDLREEDMVMGVLYLGYADTRPMASRKTTIAEKCNWIK